MSDVPASDLEARIRATLSGMGPVVVACSGGIDSTLLALVAHRMSPDGTLVAHAVSPAVPGEGTALVRDMAAKEGWHLRIVQSGEFADENYLSNPANRCYFCKSNLYSSLDRIGAELGGEGTVVSGANLDDLGEYRPGLEAASEHGVRHPWIEAGFGKAEIRELARQLGQPFAELPASPCLASRLYTGTRVTSGRLDAVHACEGLIKERTGIAVVRCRVREGEMLVEVADGNRALIDAALLAELAELAKSREAGIASVALDDRAYSPGRAFVRAQ